MAVTGKAVGTVGGAAAGSFFGPAGTVVGGALGGLVGGLFDSDSNKAPPVQVDWNNYSYGAKMSPTGQAQVDQYNAQGQGLRQQALMSQAQPLRGPNAMNSAVPAAARANQLAQNTSDSASRQQQMQALGRMQSGNDALSQFAQQPQGPSAAEAQLQAGANQSFAQQMAAARSGGNGGGNANALRNAAFQQSSIMGQENAQAATLRAQEQQAFKQQQMQALGMAQQGYGQEAGAATNVRSGDQSLAGLQSSTALQSGQLATNAALGQNQLELQGRQVNNQYSLGLDQLAGQQDLNTQHVYDQQGQMNQNAQAMSSSIQGVAGQQQIAAQNRHDDQVMGMVGGAAQGLATMSDERSKKEIQSLKGELAQAYGAIGDHSRAGRDAQTYQGEPDPTAHLGTRPSSAGQPAANYDHARGAAFTRQLESRNAMAQAYGAPDLRGAPGSAYEYKDPSAPGAAPGEHIGPMAQDLEANPATAHTVHTGPDGMKRVDTGRLALTNTSAISDQQRRMDDLEQRVAGMQPANDTAAWRARAYGIDNPEIPGPQGPQGPTAPQLSPQDDPEWLNRYMAMGGR